MISNDFRAFPMISRSFFKVSWRLIVQWNDWRPHCPGSEACSPGTCHLRPPAAPRPHDSLHTSCFSCFSCHVSSLSKLFFHAFSWLSRLRRAFPWPFFIFFPWFSDSFQCSMAQKSVSIAARLIDDSGVVHPPSHAIADGSRGLVRIHFSFQTISAPACGEGSTT